MKVSPFHKILSRCLHHRAGTLQGGAVAVPLDLPAVAVAVGDPEQLHQVNGSKTTMEQTVEQSPCRRSSPENRDYSPWMQVLTFKSMTARPSRGSVTAFQVQGDA